MTYSTVHPPRGQQASIWEALTSILITANGIYSTGEF